MARINPYLTFNGNCEEVFLFYKSVFGNDFVFFGRYSEMPAQFNIPESEKSLVMHVSLPIGKGETILMGSDSSASMGPLPVQGSNFSISIGADTKEEAEDLFSKLSYNGEVNQSMGPTFWGSYFGTLMDQYGIHWMVSFDPNLVNNDH